MEQKGPKDLLRSPRPLNKTRRTLKTMSSNIMSKDIRQKLLYCLVYTEIIPLFILILYPLSSILIKSWRKPFNVRFYVYFYILTYMNLVR